MQRISLGAGNAHRVLHIVHSVYYGVAMVAFDNHTNYDSDGKSRSV